MKQSIEQYYEIIQQKDENKLNVGKMYVKLYYQHKTHNNQYQIFHENMYDNNKINN
jgi:hypothetical protein